MAEKPLHHLTLREMCNELERMLNELEEHLDRGFQPKVKALRKLAKTSDADPELTKDITVRNHAADLLKSEFFTDELYEKIRKYFEAIDHSVSHIVGEE